MVSDLQNEFIPDYASPPGDTLQDLLDDVGMSQTELALRLGRTSKFVNELVQAKAPLTPDTALLLEKVFDIKADYWNNRERHYRETLARLKEEHRLAEKVDWLEKVPYRDMVKQGWITGFATKLDQLREVLRFYGVASPEQCEALWEYTANAAHFRRSPAFDLDAASTEAWLRKGEIDAQKIGCAPYAEAVFRQALAQIRAALVGLTDFGARVVDECARAGVAVVIVPELPRTCAHGATRWLSPAKAVIQLSLRYKTDDQFWFSFFHEAAHVLLHKKRAIYVEQEGQSGDSEKEANSFAADALISPAAWRTFIASANATTTVGIKEFARRIELPPGIVVDRLQHEKRLPWQSYANDLKAKIPYQTFGIVE